MECIDKEDQMELCYLQIKTSTEIKVFWEVLKFKIARIRMQIMATSFKEIKQLIRIKAIKIVHLELVTIIETASIFKY